MGDVNQAIQANREEVNQKMPLTGSNHHMVSVTSLIFELVDTLADTGLTSKAKYSAGSGAKKEKPKKV